VTADLKKNPLAGVEELRQLARMSGHCNESAYDGFTMNEVVNMLRACRDSDWDILPDELYADERKSAGRTGVLTEICVKRLKEKYG
jgi:hypothetical protein